MFQHNLVIRINFGFVHFSKPQILHIVMWWRCWNFTCLYTSTTPWFKHWKNTKKKTEFAKWISRRTEAAFFEYLLARHGRTSFCLWRAHDTEVHLDASIAVIDCGSVFVLDCCFKSHLFKWQKKTLVNIWLCLGTKTNWLWFGKGHILAWMPAFAAWNASDVLLYNTQFLVCRSRTVVCCCLHLDVRPSSIPSTFR